MSHLTQEQLHNLQQKLMDRKVELERRMVNNDQHGLGESERDMTGELSHIDNHPGDVGTEVFERGKDLALQDRVDQELQRVIFRWKPFIMAVTACALHAASPFRTSGWRLSRIRNIA